LVFSYSVEEKMKKCPHCGKPLPDDTAKPVGNPMYADGIDTEMYFEGRPSLAALAGSFIVGILFLGVAGFIAFNFPQYHGGLVALGLVLLVTLWVGVRVLVFKSTFYRVTNDRIEFEEGVFNKDVDNVDLFRIVDVRLRSSLLDRLFNIGTIELTTTDDNQPDCELFKIKNPRAIFEILKKATLGADRRRGVVHVE
jgi:membrane protein YdbS with pleckstrin-like domain